MIHKLIVPKKRVVSVSLTVPEDFIGEEIEVIAYIRKEGLQQPGTADLLSPALQGDVLNNQEFINWITKAEMMPSVSLQDAKSEWANKRKQLQQLIK